MTRSRPHAQHAYTYAHQRRDFIDWHRGRSHYLLWALDLDQAAVRARVATARRQLGSLLLAGYRRQPHVTLSLCGFPQLQPRHEDEFGSALLETQWRALRQLALRPFDIRIAAAGSFLAAPYLHIEDDSDQLQQLHRALAIHSPPGADIAYQPHLTLGLYRQRRPLQAVLDQLARLPSAAPLSLPVTHLNLLAYASADIDGPLQTVARFALASGALQPVPGGHQYLPFALPR